MKEQSLNGTWTLYARRVVRNKFKVSKGSTLDIRIPGDVHAALLEQKIIPDPYWGTNELDLQWIGQSDWTISRDFEFRKVASKVYLSLEKVDTIAKLYINGVFVKAFENEHQIHWLDVSAFVKDGANHIEFRFTSSEKIALQRNAKLPYIFPCGSDPVSSPHKNLVRKTSCNGGWDWGPCFMLCGIHEDVKLVQVDKVLLESFSCIPQKNSNGSWVIKTELYTQAQEKTKENVHIRLSKNGKTVKEWQKEVSVSAGRRMSKLSLTVPAKEVELWWPNGYGAQPLYNLEVTLGECRKAKKTAFRTMVVRNEPTMGGKELTVCVNGQDIFCKGANWIPQDAMASRITTERYEQFMKDMVWANMNMVRIWGGGWYEKEAFYEACDKYGILIYHDMMFACASYPTMSWFTKSVRRELQDQIRRLKSHPSIALWCGNNEDFGCLSWHPEIKDELEKYYDEYDKFNDGTVGKTVLENDSTRIFWPSSPCSGPGDRTDNWHVDGKGDMHYWTVWHGRKDIDTYHTIRPRFCSEFGYQSYPSLAEVKTFADDSQLGIFSPVMLHHQKNDNGNQIIAENFTRLYFEKGFDVEAIEFPKLLYLSQIQQSLAISTAVTYWRSLMPYCMGTIYWQLNDVWPVCSWSSIEYSGRFKALHYEARRFYRQVAPLLYTKDGELHLDLANDSKLAQNTDVAVSFIDFAGRLSDSELISVTAEPMVSKELRRYSLKDLKCQDVFCYVSIRSADTVDNYTILLGNPKDMHFEDPKVKMICEKTSDKVCLVRLSCSAPAFNVMVSTSDKGHFSDNNVTLLPGKETVLEFTSDSVISNNFRVDDLFSALS